MKFIINKDQRTALKIYPTIALISKKYLFNTIVNYLC